MHVPQVVGQAYEHAKQSVGTFSTNLQKGVTQLKDSREGKVLAALFTVAVIALIISLDGGYTWTGLSSAAGAAGITYFVAQKGKQAALN